MIVNKQVLLHIEMANGPISMSTNYALIGMGHFAIRTMVLLNNGGAWGFVVL